MLTRIKNILFLFLVFSFLGTLSHNAHAACSPGIPCTDYDIISDPNAGTDPNLNGPKSGAPSPFTNPSGATTTSCDGNFMNQIYSRAFMEASREVILSAQMIHKPDSVLEYSCFHQQVNMAAVHGGKAFSESTQFEDKDFQLLTGGWNTTNDGIEPDESIIEPINNTSANLGIPEQEKYSVFSEERLDLILSEYLKESIKTYVDSNFSHTFLGDAISIDSETIDPSEPLDSSTTFDCSHMKAIWDIAKCVDFGEDDQFRSFNHFIEYDPRSIPRSCSPGNETNDSIGGPDGDTLDNSPPGLIMGSGGLQDLCPPAGGPQAGVNTGGFSNDMIRLMNNCDNGSSTDPQKLFAAFNYMDTHKDLIKGHGIYLPGVGNLTGIIGCGSPRSTGIPVLTYTHSMATDPDLNNAMFASRETEIHYDAVCPNPACYFIPFKVPHVIGAPLSILLNTQDDAIGPGVCVPSL